ncbi:YqgE/AlgH family protein [Pleionea sediminis]|uniref:YqgE/AlgH family protein n=1 Tax=Pleionea sediminis TaxID=2569479 RepID=UPI001185F446|nr:YqgE/AlgH family protein [Pleionea sediminis]
MSEFQSLKNHFLIAMPSLQDPNFVRSVTLLCEHNEEGAMGIVVNHPTEVTTSELLDHLEIKISPDFNERPVLAGGPVQTDRGFVIHRNDKHWQSSLEVSKDIIITTSQDILKAFPHDDTLSDAFIALGYAGWGPGQLENELAENAWLSTPASADILFKTKVSERWNKATALLGIDISQLSFEAGHA